MLQLNGKTAELNGVGKMLGYGVSILNLVSQ